MKLKLPSGIEIDLKLKNRLIVENVEKINFNGLIDNLIIISKCKICGTNIRLSDIK